MMRRRLTCKPSIATVVAGYDLRFSVAVQFADGRTPTKDIIVRLNEVLQRVDENLRTQVSPHFT
jgi:hypothetical protein